MKRGRKKEKKKLRSRCEKKKKKNLVIRQDTKYWVPFIDKNY